MNDGMTTSLVVMAVSLAVMALVQVGLIIAAIIVVRKALAAVADLQREVRPLIEKANRIADEAQRTSSLVTLQMERVDGLMATTATRLDNTLGIVQHAMSGPVGQGVAAVKAVQAAVSVLRDWKGRRRRHSHDDEDALFVG